MSIFGDFMIDEATKLQGKLGDAEAYAHKLRSELTTAQQQRDGLYRALAELVACKEEKMPAIDPLYGGTFTLETPSRFDKAWHAARTALSAAQPKEKT